MSKGVLELSVFENFGLNETAFGNVPTLNLLQSTSEFALNHISVCLQKSVNGGAADLVGIANVSGGLTLPGSDVKSYFGRKNSFFSKSL